MKKHIAQQHELPLGLPEPPKPLITKLDTLRWMPVSLASTVAAANAACLGVNFQGCSKGHIFNEFAKVNLWSCQRNTPLFIRLMDNLAKVHRANAHNLRLAVASAIRTTLTEPQP